METVIQIQGEPWTNVRYLASFEEADTFRKSLKTQDKSGTLQVKVKRCGGDKPLYVVKSRTDPSLKAALEEIEEKMLVVKKSKKTKK
jgi:hypothetical protein